VIDKDVETLTSISDRTYIMEKGAVVWTGESHADNLTTELKMRYLGILDKGQIVEANEYLFVLALLVVTIWGANFTVVKLGLDGVPPMLLVALRFVFVILPAILFVRRPAVSARYWMTYGAAVGIGQFGCLFYAMHIGMPAGVGIRRSSVTGIFYPDICRNTFAGEDINSPVDWSCSIVSGALPRLVWQW